MDGFQLPHGSRVFPRPWPLSMTIPGFATFERVTALSSLECEELVIRRPETYECILECECPDLRHPADVFWFHPGGGVGAAFWSMP